MTAAQWSEGRELVDETGDVSKGQNMTRRRTLDFIELVENH
jgi:hypothetical protein